MFLLLSTLFAIVYSAMSQDIIITTDSQKIEAVIETVSDSEVHYKRFTNPTGPTFIISTNKITSITYSNGEVETFMNNEMNIETQKTDKIAITQMYEIDDTYFYGDIRMNEIEYVSFLEKNCPVAYQQYVKGNNKIGTAKGLLFSGIAFDTAGIILTIVGATNANISEGMITFGGALMGIGTVFEIACIPTWIIGGRQRANALDIFNNTCASINQPQAYWSINASQNGIGLALNF